MSWFPIEGPFDDATFDGGVDAEVIAAPGAGNQLVIYSMSYNPSVGGTMFRLRSGGAAGTIKWSQDGAANRLASQSIICGIFACLENENLFIQTGAGQVVAINVTYAIQPLVPVIGRRG